MILGISHDANNLLHSIVGNISLLDLQIKSKKHWNETSEALLRSASTSAEHLKYLISQALDLALNKNHTHAHIRMNYTDFNVADSLRRLRAMILPECKKKGLRLEVTLEEVTPMRVRMDEDKLMQILLNLLGNAIKFTERGEISVGVSWRTNMEAPQEGECDEEVSENDGFGLMPVAQKVRKMVFSSRSLRINAQRSITIGDEVENILRPTASMGLIQRNNRDEHGELVIWVIDTGCGISEENLQKLFVKGEQVHSNVGARRCGRGLGLWYIKHILQLMEGRIQVKSIVNLGTRFLVTIPCSATNSS